VKKALFAILVASVAVCAGGARADGAAMSPKDVVNAFDQMAFVDHKPVEAIKLYFSPDVIEHDPTTPNGRDAIIAYMQRRNWTSNKMRDIIDHVIAEGDLVVVHHRVVQDGQPDLAAIDIFKVEHGQVVEHWDVLQPVPKTSANNNTMF
jgi:predicted SnoaL-like aldol condensation-catalyzing enzyme